MWSHWPVRGVVGEEVGSSDGDGDHGKDQGGHGGMAELWLLQPEVDILLLKGRNVNNSVDMFGMIEVE